MSDIDWRRSDEDFRYGTFGHFAVFERTDRKPERRSPLQRVMRQVKELRGERYQEHIHIPSGLTDHRLADFMHQSWFQLPAYQKEEHLLRQVDWSGVSDATRATASKTTLRVA